MADDLLHIVIPFYNASRTLAATLESLSCIPSARRRDVLVIGVDDGSSDGSATIFTDHPVLREGFHSRLIHRKNGGTGAARNDALTSFDAGWTMFLDADDDLLLDPWPFLADNGMKTALIFDTVSSRRGRRIAFDRAEVPEPFAEVITSKNPFPVSAVIFRRELVTNLFREDIRFLEDWLFWAVNPAIFNNPTALRGNILSRINVAPVNKSSDQKGNGRCRVAVADLIAASLGKSLSNVARNNIDVQKAIGHIQMGGGRKWGAFLSFPVTPSLYMKLVVYVLMFPLYRSFNRYGDFFRDEGTTS